MIGIVYGYYVRHGGVGRYIAESLKHFKNPSNFELITIEKSLDTPSETRILLVKCKRDRRLMSISENKSFSDSIKKLSKRYNAIHSHGVYHFVPDLYTAHICIASYFSRFIYFFGKSCLPVHLRGFSKFVDIEAEMICNLSNGQLIAASNKVADELSVKYGVNRKNIKILQGASRFYGREKNRQANKENKVPTVGFIGGDLYAKGIIFIKDIFNKLISRGIKLQCVVAGCGDGVKEFLSSNARYKIDIMGKYEISENFYKNLDIFLCLSIYEAYSLSTLEAMSLGIPVISSNLNGVFYDSKKEELLLAEVKDVSNPANVSDMIERIICDEDFKNKIVGSGYKIANRHTWKDVASSYENIYKTFL